MMTSVRANPPHMTSPPRSTQAAMAQPNVGTASATACGFLNTPEPMTVPTTRAVAIHGPRTRSSWSLVPCPLSLVRWFMTDSPGVSRPLPNRHATRRDKGQGTKDEGQEMEFGGEFTDRRGGRPILSEFSAQSAPYALVIR